MATNQNSNSSQERNPQNSEKCYIIYNSPDYNYACALKNLSQENFQGIPCLKGTSVHNDWSQGRTFHIPVKHIYQVVEYDSVEDFIKSEGKIASNKIARRSIFRSSR